ncbi:unnamed protein product [Ophioblennius macclurei]
MEIGTEISKKIREAIKGKLQELGAYIDEDLPDYIMVMVANKKTSHQMADDLSLFLGNNTLKFTTWLQGVLEKLRSVAGEPASLKHQLQFDGGLTSSKGRMSIGEHSRGDESKVLMVSSSRSDRTEARVSSSAHESRKGSVETSSSLLTSTVKPLMELLPSEAVIDIKPEMDDDLIGEDALEINNNGHHGRTSSRSAAAAAEMYRSGQSKFTSMSSASRSVDGSSHSRQPQDGRSRSSRNGSSKSEEMSRKRKAPVASSVVRVSRAADDDSDEVEEDDGGYGGGGRGGLSSRVSLPSKPERKPTLPPTKQATRNLILKAISEAQDSITKTTAYTIPQKQTVPVAPRTRMSESEEMTAAIQLVQEHLHSLAPRASAYASSASLPPPRTACPDRSLATRLQLERNDQRQQHQFGVEVTAGGEGKASDTRSFIVSRVQAEGSPARLQQHVLSSLPRTVQASKDKAESSSPKFIVTLDGVPSPLGNLADCDMELDHVRPPAKVAAEGGAHVHKEPKVSILDRLQGVFSSPPDDMMEVEMADEEEDEDNVPLKKQKVLERCKFWPVCKSGDECLFHHPTTQCKTFPNCKFGDKCLFVHPNCKYDARCTKPECPFTHVSRRGGATAAAPPPRPALQPLQSSSVCRFFPDCKKMDCAFYHPKPCRFAAQCKRAGCTFYHPTSAVPPRHALKWTKAQSS